MDVLHRMWLSVSTLGPTWLKQLGQGPSPGRMRATQSPVLSQILRFILSLEQLCVQEQTDLFDWRLILWGVRQRGDCRARRLKDNTANSSTEVQPVFTLAVTPLARRCLTLWQRIFGDVKPCSGMNGEPPNTCPSLIPGAWKCHPMSKRVLAAVRKLKFSG